jgi:hypothetical protein
MASGTSWTVEGTSPGTDGYRIHRSLERGDVRWNLRTSKWLAKHFDRTLFNQRRVAQMIWEHVKAGGRIRGQHNTPGEEYDVWFYVEMNLDGEVRFIKFVIEPDDDDNPGVLIVSAHPPQ